MSLLTDALSKPDPPTDETAESAITELEEELDISGELDESSRDPTIQAVALDELMLEELEATRRQRESHAPGEEESSDDQTPYAAAAIDVLSAEEVLASQSIVLEELPEGTLDKTSEPLTMAQEPPTLTDTNAGPDPTMVIMPDRNTFPAKRRPRTFKLISGALLVTIAVVAGLLYFNPRPSAEPFGDESSQIDQSVAAEPAKLSSLGPAPTQAAATSPAQSPTQLTDQSPSAPNVSPSVEKRPSFSREPATAADVRGFTAAVDHSTESRPDSQPTIEIARTRRQNPVYLALKEAYAKFQRGDFDAAGLLYQEALDLDPNNIDALLGRAAIAQRENNLTEAQNFYRTALSLDPRNTIALAGIMSLQKASSTVENESELKSMLAQQPQAAHLHFALGLHYVSLSRWPDAQQSFFEAVRHDPANADYAFNLAVSLDQLSQRDAAATYYRQAIKLARGAQKFELDSARKRLNSLTASN